MPAGVYLHIPFCKSRCSYCDFATDVYRDNDAVERYVNALVNEMTEGGNPTGRKGAHDYSYSTSRTLATARVSALSADTIYFGGGTPSLLAPKQLEQILETVTSKFDISSNAEITMEMNPATVTPDTLREYRSLGVNRASFGVQTFDDHALKLLARGHDANDARTTFTMLREAGFDNVSFDLIAGLPGQTLDDWERNLSQAVAMSPEHLSLYLLEIHEGTPLAEQVRSGRQPTPDDDLAAAMYEMMLDRLAAAGYEQYEISNFCRPGFESRHNTKYWRLEPVFGFGVSAHSFDGVERFANVRDTADYVSKILDSGSAEVSRERIDAASEFIFLGLRLNVGVSFDEYEQNFGADLRTIYAEKLAELSEKELVTLSSHHVALTRKGMLFSNEVFTEFV